MKKNKTIIISFLIGFLISGLSYFVEIDKGDYIFRGFPIGFYNGIWGNAFKWYFSPQALFFDLIIWSLTVFITIKFTIKFKKYIK